MSQLLKDFAYTPPTIGQIKTGHLEWDDDKDMNLPKQDPFISVMSQVKDSSGMWIPHPVVKKLHNELKAEVVLNRDGEFTSIPVRLPFDNIDLNFSEHIEAYDNKTGRRVCSSKGAGMEFKRIAIHAVGPDEKVCPGPENCVFGIRMGCKLIGRLYTKVEGQEDADSSFIFRTRGFNSVKTLRWRLEKFSKLTDGHPTALKLALSIKAKSTRQSFGRPVYYLDLTLRGSQNEIDARVEALADKRKEEDAGYPRSEIENRLLELLGNGTTIDTVEEEMELADWLSSSDLAHEESEPVQSASNSPVSTPADLEAAIAAVAEASIDLVEPLGAQQLRDATDVSPSSSVLLEEPAVTPAQNTPAEQAVEPASELQHVPSLGLGDLRTTIQVVNSMGEGSAFTGFTDSVLGSTQPDSPAEIDTDGWACPPPGFNAANFASPRN